MFDKLIEMSVKNRMIVLILTAIIFVFGIQAMRTIPLDAIPDLSDVQVIVFTKYPGQAPQVVEDQVTYPLTTTMLSVPNASIVRGYSFFGFSFVYIIFEDGTDMYWARSRVLEYLNFVSNQLPDGVTPTLGPDATGVGWVYQYVLKSKKHDLSELRSIQDWFLKYELISVPGVSEVASVGGFVKQYQVDIDPNKLLAYNIPLKKVHMAIKRSNNDVGGRLIEMAETEYMVRGLGYIKSLDDIRNTVVDVSADGTPILVKELGTVHIGPDIRRGLIEMNGEGEVVGGVIVMRFGENALKTIENVKKKLEELKSGLPEGVTIESVYDRSGLINRSIATLKSTLLIEIVIVTFVCIIFLLHFPSAMVAVFTLPIGILVSFILMKVNGVNANIMSLGGIAIAIGVMVDAAVVLVENFHKYLQNKKEGDDHWDLVIESSKEVGPALAFALVIITVSFLPIFALTGQEGRLFRPLAYTWVYALGASSLIALTIIPILIGYFVRGKIKSEDENPIVKKEIAAYKPMMKFFLKKKKTVLLVSIIIAVLSVIPYKQLGSEFMPPLYEGDLLYMPTTFPGISITKAKQILQQADKIIKTFPEVHQVLGKVGRIESATDASPLSMMETIIQLKPEKEWRKGMTVKKLIKELDEAVKFPGVTNAWTMPIKTRVDMLSTGIKTPVGIKIAGPDLTVLQDLGKEIETVVRKVPGTLSVYSERVVGGNFLDIDIDRLAAARYGLTVGDVQDIIKTAIGGMNITTTVEGLERYPVNIRYARELRDDIESIKRVLVPTPRGEQIPLMQLSRIEVVKGPPVIKSENAKLNAWIYVDLKTSDVGSYVKAAQEAVKENIKFPAGYSIVWSGQYEYMERANKRLAVAVPVTLAIIFLLLYFYFKSFKESMIVMLSLPFSLVGGIWYVYILGFNMSVAVGIGFIALFGLAAETGMVMLVYLKLVYEERLKKGELKNMEDVNKAVLDASIMRIRAVSMTVGTTMIGLLPVMFMGGSGSQVMQRIAAPMIGGLVTSTILTLVVIPIIFSIWKSGSFKKEMLEFSKN
ncbi:Cobalt-zinc-cadmium resistance protein CzcA; Cation efflux system protein CusA [hydrothermal vent metagenome]|uniref:Cobalt-zinc-cadmium resistance protein CzcA Cation efflux system protein CusA n=1 Tax=hydrothermal vent metagenome TaxID=652676 RepID=A0A3B1DIP2_9ZZZZ